MAEPAQPVQDALGAQDLRHGVGGQGGNEFLAGGVARVREEREAEEELVDCEQRGGDETGRLDEGGLQVLTAAQGLQQGAEVAGRLKSLVFGLRGGPVVWTAA